MSNIYDRVEDTLVNMARFLRDDLSEVDDLTYMDLEISISGRVLDGDLEIKFTLGNGSYNKTTSGGNLGNVVDEYKRRHGWNKRNSPLCLPKVIDDKVDEEIPF